MEKKLIPRGFSFLPITLTLVSYDQPHGRILNVSLRLGIALKIDVGTNMRNVGDENSFSRIYSLN
jgi:hypothetical protein